MIKKIFMIFIVLFILFMFSVTVTHAAEKSQGLNMTCQDFKWADIEELVQPYLSDTLFTTLVMQGQSAEYITSAAAEQAMDKSLPDVIKRILYAVIKSGC